MMRVINIRFEIFLREDFLDTSDWQKAVNNFLRQNEDLGRHIQCFISERQVIVQHGDVIVENNDRDNSNLAILDGGRSN